MSDIRNLIPVFRAEPETGQVLLTQQTAQLTVVQVISPTNVQAGSDVWELSAGLWVSHGRGAVLTAETDIGHDERLLGWIGWLEHVRELRGLRSEEFNTAHHYLNLYADALRNQMTHQLAQTFREIAAS